LPGVKCHDDFVHEGDIELPGEIEKTLLNKFVNQSQDKMEGKRLTSILTESTVDAWCVVDEQDSERAD
jgi:hypothetical protein